MKTSEIEIRINEYISLRPFKHEDWYNLMNYLNDEEVYKNTLLLPYPYTREAAEGWIDMNRKNNILKDKGGNLGIYFKETGLIGGIGFSCNPDKKLRHQAEIGYWLGAPFRHKGYMKAIIMDFSRWIFEHTEYKKIIASTFVHNTASGKLLEKCGYTREGLLRHHIKKNNELIDCVVYGLLKDEIG
jgi:RimJ/RimL family protein N-acetyltransferase